MQPAWFHVACHICIHHTFKQESLLTDHLLRTNADCHLNSHLVATWHSFWGVCLVCILPWR